MTVNQTTVNLKSLNFLKKFTTLVYCWKCLEELLQFPVHMLLKEFLNHIKPQLLDFTCCTVEEICIGHISLPFVIMNAHLRVVVPTFWRSCASFSHGDVHY